MVGNDDQKRIFPQSWSDEPTNFLSNLETLMLWSDLNMECYRAPTIHKVTNFHVPDSDAEKRLIIMFVLISMSMSMNRNRSMNISSLFFKPSWASQID